MDQSQISRYKTLDFFARQVVEGFITGRHKSPFHGFSVEFSDYRQYNTGESTRNIDWHLYGRTPPANDGAASARNAHAMLMIFMLMPFISRVCKVG